MHKKQKKTEKKCYVNPIKSENVLLHTNTKKTGTSCLMQNFLSIEVENSYYLKSEIAQIKYNDNKIVKYRELVK